jgi:hypothetical protein
LKTVTDVSRRNGGKRSDNRAENEELSGMKSRNFMEVFQPAGAVLKTGVLISDVASASFSWIIG